MFTIILLAAAIMVGIILLFLQGDRMRDSFDEDVRRFEELVQTLDELEISFLKARRAEKDFLLRQDVGNIDRHAEAMTLLNERSAHARILARDTGGEVTGLLDGVDRLIKAYATGFASLVESHRLLGFNEDDGLQGALRAAVHEIEMVLKEASTPEMQVKMLMMRRHEKDFIMRVDPKYRDRLNARVEEFRAFPADYYVDESQRLRIDNLLERYQKSFNAFVEETLREQRLQQDLSAAYSEVEPLVSRLHEVSRKRKNEVSYAATVATAAAHERVLTLSAAGLVVFVLLALSVSMAISRPLKTVSAALRKIMDGDFSHALRPSWIAEANAISTAVEVFRSDLAEKEQLSRDISSVIDACAAGDFSRRLPDPGANSSSADIVRGVNAIGDSAQKGLGDVLTALDTLSSGDLSVAMPVGHQGVFLDISRALESVVSNLAGIVLQLSRSSETLNRTARKIADSADNASQRGQNSAASLEETAAALQTLEHNVRGATENAKSAERHVTTARERAEATRSVADSAVDSIRKIEQSSQSIGQITDMIEDVAFQTNLLALNAGVEAARAGEAGRGFAVVASEVRALAKRATEAAGEINSLIRSSEGHVVDGVRHVSETVDALSSIQEAVVHVYDKVTEISATAVEQATSITEINTAVGSLDHDVQKNAAILDETATAGQELTTEADTLVELVRKFKLPTQERSGIHPFAAE
ncbi:methyl-accepting chemotaxis protein [Rhodovulum sulfidophilum]|uniref:Methyl-accepting chemotaxis protein n=1 Tax=Rhodovulum sulfidophilum TaxID=35806 RepID=A0ABS1RVN5_RHOSU|nr:methyl-accepting chemotaxis protein [Rhodovulum sulfidophilum]MBL3610157.1 methyl-accepting chemotaxis protein [Rhodovulum sulfidophilum]MCE8456709.1 methyl-accepting chemotaxis protein [Rhodovulum sulfidophilum]